MPDTDDSQATHLFISYSHDDADVVERLKRDLTAAGALIWIDHEQLQPGAPDWEEAIRTGIQRAAFVIYIASPTARASQFVRDEINLARAKGRRVIPFWARGEEWHDCIPLGWGMTQHADGRDERYPSGLNDLLRALSLSPTASPQQSPSLPQSWQIPTSAATARNGRAAPGAPGMLAPRERFTVQAPAAIASLGWASDGRLATGSPDAIARVWDGFAGTALRALSGHTGAIYSIAWVSDGARLATAGADRVARIWDTLAGAATLALSGHASDILAIAWSPEGTRLASGSRDHQLWLWDAATGQREDALDGHTGAVYGVAWSPNGSLLASASDDRTAVIWDVESKRRVRALHGHGGDVNSVAWSPDGARLATASDDMTARVWDVASGRALLRLTGHGDRIRNLAWSPDGAWIVTASYDHDARIWDAETGEHMATLAGHTDSVYSVAWSPDGARVATGSNDRTLRVWDITR
jgi:dipeptidyl aminopeptidase/acylaminoacyl peptidase